MRHTHIIVANAAGLSQYDIKLSVNHALPKGDVTSSHISPDVEVLREPQRRVTDYLLGLIDPKEVDNALIKKKGLRFK